MTKQIVIHTDLYEKSPISENYVFEGDGFAGSINPNSRNVSVTEATATPIKHDAFLDGEGDLWVWHNQAFRMWIPKSRRINTGFGFLTREDVESRFGEGEEI